MHNRFIVGEPENVPIWGNGDSPFYPLIDTVIGERFGDTFYRSHDDAAEAAAQYNKMVSNDV